MAIDWEKRYTILIQELQKLLEGWHKTQINDSYYWTELNAGREEGIHGCADDLKYLIEEKIKESYEGV